MLWSPGTQHKLVPGAAVEDKEALRHEARCRREQERLKKLGPGRLRSIGADIAGMKNQVEEKQRQEEADREVQRRGDQEDEAIRRYLLQVESDDALAKRQEMVTLRNDWQLQTAERDLARERDARERAISIEPETCAPGAAQKFHGEDPQRLERTRLQALQMKEWMLAQMDERRQREALNADDERQFALYVAEIERFQQALQTSTERERAQIALELQRFNQFLLDDKRERDRRQKLQEQALEADEVQKTLESNLISENRLQALLPGLTLDQRVRVDHWKGFSPDQTRRYLKQNDDLLADKARQQQQMKHDAAADARRQSDLNRILVEEEHNVQRKRAMEQLAIKEAQERQAREAAEREHKNAQQARGKFEPTFFQSFGRSYR